MYLRHVSNGSNGSRLSHTHSPHPAPPEAPRMTFFKVVAGGGGGGRWSRDESWVCVTLTHQGGNWAHKGASLVF